MAYKQIDDKDFEKDLSLRKEFYYLTEEVDKEKPYYDADRFNKKILNLMPHQIFPKNYLNIFTPYNRFLLNYSVGLGKTTSSLAVAMEYIKIYFKEFERQGKSPDVNIIGFSSEVFKNELLKFPEFGYISRRELYILKQLEIQIETSGNPIYQKRYNDIYNKIRGRLSKKKDRGLFRFYGFQMLVNHLFIIIDPSVKKLDRHLNEYIRLKKIKINKKFLDSFKDSLIIVDEVHNVYNTIESNNYGVALRVILDYHKENVKCLFLSATPITNSPTEIIDLLKLLTSEKLKKKEFFDSNGELLPDAKNRIANYLKGRVSFLQDSSLEFYPKKIILGKISKLPFNIQYLKADPNTNINYIPYLKFIECPMSELHFNTYKNLELVDKQIANVNIKVPTISVGEQTLNDGVFPNPKNNKIGLYKSFNFKRLIISASDKWKNKVGIKLIEKNGIKLISGNFLDKKNIQNYFTKYSKLLDDLLDTPGKCFIYHHYVRMSGVLLIQELLEANGYVDEYSAATDNTKCYWCDVIKSKHKKYKSTDKNQTLNNHEYYPARFIVAHSEGIDKKKLNESLRKYNLSDNSDGHLYKILIASKILKEAYSLLSVRFAFIMTLPINIPTLIQVLGRFDRYKSHINLPPEKRNVSIRIYVSTIPNKNKSYQISAEKLRYVKKMKDYMIIQQINKLIGENSVDGYIHKNKIMKLFQSENDSKLFPNEWANEKYFNLLPYKLNYDIEYGKKLNELNTITYNAYGYFEKEIHNIIILIKRAFLQNPIWKYNDLLYEIRNSNNTTGYNKKLLNEDLFKIALQFLIGIDYNVIKNVSNESDEYKELYILNTLFDPNQIFIIDNLGNVKKIINVDEYYILTQVIENYSYLDINSYINETIGIDNIQIVIPKNYNLEKRFKKIIKSLNNMADEFSKLDMYIILLTQDENFIVYLLKGIITGDIDDIVNDKLYKIILEIFKLIGMLVVKKGEPVGYNYKNNYKYYDDNIWYDERREITNWKDNNIIVGFFEDDTFKLRKPRKQLTVLRKGEKDLRKLEKGMRCTTYPKKDIKNIANKLKIKYNDNIKSKELCSDILKELLEREIIERKKKSNIKYLYYYNDIVELV